MIFGYYHMAADLSSRAHNGFRGAVEERKMRVLAKVRTRSYLIGWISR